jgi:ActR/RegA family two-component response regulator
MTAEKAPRKESILIVEDDPSLNRRLHEVLGSRWAVDGALSAAEASAKLEAEHFDLLLLDLHLPDRHGLELLEELEREGLVSRAIILTGHGDRNSAIEALRLHSLDFLTKPVDAEVLSAAVEKALAQDPVVTAPLDALLTRARRFLREGRIEGAESQLRAARMHQPDSPEIVNLLGVAAELRHDLTEAVDLYHLADSLRPYAPARRNSERLVFRSWQGPGHGVAIDFGLEDDEV